MFKPIAEDMAQVGATAFRLYPKPWFYPTSGGIYAPIDESHVELTGIIAQAEYAKKLRGIRGVEFRKDTALSNVPKDNFLLLLGPNGERLEITLVSVLYDGSPITVNLKPPAFPTKTLVDMAGARIQTRRDGCRVLALGAKGLRTVGAVFNIRPVDMDWKADKNKFVFTSKKTKEVLFILNPPGLCSGEGNRILGLSNGTHFMTDIGGGLFRYTKTLEGLDKLILPSSWWLDVDVSYVAGESGTWTVPSGVTALLVTMCAGGGSGAPGKAGTADGSGGGGAGTIYQKTMIVSPGAGLAYSVGAGGAAVLLNGNWHNGVNGADTTFGTYTASKGLGGVGWNSGTSPDGDGGAGGAATDGVDTGVAGAGGTTGSTEGKDGTNVGACWGGGGGGRPGAPPIGKGGTGYDSTRASAGNYGGGGGSSYGAGGAGSPNATTNGSPGTDGGGGGGAFVNLGYYSGAGGDGFIFFSYEQPPSGQCIMPIVIG